MDEFIAQAKDWFSGGAALGEMQRYQGRLKLWEAKVVKSFPAHASILNIGCGTGREAFALHAMGFRVTGVDVSETAITIARGAAAEQGVCIDFLVTDGTSVPFDDASFDAVILWAQTFGLFHGEKNQQHILTECGRVLRPGGLLSFSGHDREYQQLHCAEYLEGRRFYPFAETDLYYESFMIGELRGAAQQAGFEVLACERGSIFSKTDGTVLHCLCKCVNP